MSSNFIDIKPHVGWIRSVDDFTMKLRLLQAIKVQLEREKYYSTKCEMIFLILSLLLLLSIWPYPATGCWTIATENIAKIEDGFQRKSQFWFKTFESLTLQNVHTIHGYFTLMYHWSRYFSRWSCYETGSYFSSNKNRWASNHQ